MKTLATVATMASIAALAACGGGSSGENTPVVMDAPAPSQVRVIDADTVDIDGVRFRLFGIDAPESAQTCRTWGRIWDCGAVATEVLMSRVEGMSCEGSETDRYGRMIGVCGSGGEDLNAWLVANGWALAYRQYSEDYVNEEEQARSNKRGMHRGEFIEPWRWRQGERMEEEDTFAPITSGQLNVDALVDRMLRGNDPDVYGHSLDGSVFGIVDDAAAFSFGDWPGTDPSGTGGGVWEGVLVGLDTRTRERIEGDALIEIDDFARPEVDISFTGIEDMRGGARADLKWEALPVGAWRLSDSGHGRLDQRPVLRKRPRRSGRHLRTRSVDGGLRRFALMGPVIGYPHRKRSARIKTTLTRHSVEAHAPAGRLFIAWGDRLSRASASEDQPCGTKTFVVNYRSGSGDRSVPHQRVTPGSFGCITPGQPPAHGQGRARSTASFFGPRLPASPPPRPEDVGRRPARR